jgi:hypothetical protein
MYLTLLFSIFSILKIVNIIYVYYLYSKYSNYLYSNIIIISNLILISLFIIIIFSEIYFLLVKNENKIIDFLKNAKRFFTVSLIITNLIFIFNKLYDIYIFHLTLYIFNIIQVYILYYRNKINEKELKVYP